MPQVEIPGVGLVEFPDTMSADDVSRAAKRLHEEGGTSTGPSTYRTASVDAAPSSALAAGSARIALPLLQRGAEEVATHPSLVKHSTTAGKAIGALSGILKAGPLGADAGSRIGGRLTESAATLTQRAAGSIASALEQAAPYAQSLGTLSGAQGVLDLAQMADPHRRDLGFLGVSIGSPRSAEDQAAHPALINRLLQYLLSGRSQ